MIRIIRFIVAVIAGYAVFLGCTLAIFFLTGHDAHSSHSASFVTMATIVGIIGAFAGGYLATAIDRRAGFFVALIIALAAVAALISSPGHSPWSQLATLCLMAPSAAVGFWKRRRTDRVALPDQSGGPNA